jgi:predicted oxidoreductase
MKRTIAGVMNWGVWGADLSVEELMKLIQSCVDGGVTTFDHADIYGGYTTEKSWGEAWKNLNIDRKDVEIISKCSICIPCEQRPQYQIKHYDHSAQHIIDSVLRSIKNLQCDYLDEILIHRPGPLMEPDDVGQAIRKLKKEGLIKRCGVSNFTASQMELIRTTTEIHSNQIEISLDHMDGMHDGTIDYCMTHGIEVQAWSPLGGGVLFKPSADVRIVKLRSRLNQVAEKYGWTLDQMSYLFLLHHPARIRPVTGSSKWERIKTAADAELFIISDEQWYEIWSAAQGKEVP